MCPTDIELVQRGRGEEAAFHELVDRHARDLFGLAYSLVGNAADAEDVVQETLCGAFRGLKAFEGRSSVRTWLIGILLRQAAKCRGRRNVRKAASLELLTSSSRASGGHPDPAAASTDLDARMDVAAMLEHLSPEHREAIVLRELQGLSYDEMAQAMGVPRGTVESRLFRARQELKVRLKAYLP